MTPPASTAVTVEQFLVHTSPRTKKNTLEKIIARENVQNAFIFCNRKRDVDLLARWLKEKGHGAYPMHGDMAQSARTETLRKFKAGEITLLVCSDVAARGIDVLGVSHVFNYDVPANPDDYVHRIGRTGRAGMAGHAWTLVTAAEGKQADAVQRRIRKEIPVVDIEGAGRPEEEKAGKQAGRKAQAIKSAMHRRQESKIPAKTKSPPGLWIGLRITRGTSGSEKKFRLFSMQEADDRRCG